MWKRTSPVPRDNPETGTPEISFGPAASLNWIVREEGSATRRLFENAVIEAGHDLRRLRPGLCVDSAHASLQYVRAGLGVSASVRIAARDALSRGEIVPFTIKGIRACRQFSHIINARRQIFPAATVFLEFLQKATAHLRDSSEKHCPESGN